MVTVRSGDYTFRRLLRSGDRTFRRLYAQCRRILGPPLRTPHAKMVSGRHADCRLSSVRNEQWRSVVGKQLGRASRLDGAVTLPVSTIVVLVEGLLELREVVGQGVVVTVEAALAVEVAFERDDA